ncbi:MAG: type II toxin-antitoxin system RelE/ParE family toxin [Xanthobacteraceae bacterium]
MTRVIYSRQAEDELRALWRFVAEENESAADRILLALFERIEMLRHHPQLGPRRSDIRFATRMLVEGYYLVLYENHPYVDEGAV